MELGRIIDINRRIADRGIQTLVPCFVGPTGSGKTSQVTALAREMGLPVIRMLPGTELPEDILGYPRPVRDRALGWTVAPLARRELLAATREPVVLLVDELDKAREETLSALLTLFAERRVRNLLLHPETIIIAAMQPVDPAAWIASETGRALAARLLFLPTSNGRSWDHLRGAYHLGLRYLASGHPPQPPILPEPSPRVVEWAINFTAQALSQGTDPEALAEVLSGALPAAIAAELIDEVRGSDLYDPWDALAEQGRLKEWAEAAPVGELPAHLVDTMVRDWAAGVKALERVLVDLDPDAATQVVERTLSDLYGRVEAAGGILEIPDGLGEEQGAALLEETLRRVAAEWSKRGKK